MKYKKWWLVAFLICLALATLSPLASSAPDGLERVAEDNHFVDMAAPSRFSVISGYIFPGIHNEALAVILAGWIGVTLMFVLAFGVTWLITRPHGAKPVSTSK